MSLHHIPQRAQKKRIGILLQEASRRTISSPEVRLSALSLSLLYRGADKSLSLPGGKRARNHVRDARDFNNIETRAVIKFFFPAKQGAVGNSRHSDRSIGLFPSWLGQRIISTPVPAKTLRKI